MFLVDLKTCLGLILPFQYVLSSGKSEADFILWTMPTSLLFLLWTTIMDINAFLEFHVNSFPDSKKNKQPNFSSKSFKVKSYEVVQKINYKQMVITYKNMQFPTYIIRLFMNRQIHCWVNFVIHTSHTTRAKVKTLAHVVWGRLTLISLLSPLEAYWHKNKNACELLLL